MKRSFRDLFKIFAAFFKIGAFTFGGGYAMIPLIQKESVEKHGWVSDDDILEIIAIAESTPGPIAINSATFVGIQIAGLPGAVIATAGCVFPSCVIVLTLAWVYYRFRGLTVIQGVLAGLRPAVVAMIASAGISLLIMALYGQRAIPADIFGMDYIALSIFMAGFYVLRKWKVSPMCIMAGAGVAGVISYAVF